MQRLLELYRQEILLLQELLALLERDSEIVRKGSLVELEELLESNKKKETIALKLKVLEEEKKRLESSQPFAEELENKVRELAARVLSQGERNRVLLEGSLALIRAMLGVLLPASAYRADGSLLSESPMRSRGRV